MSRWLLHGELPARGREGHRGGAVREHHEGPVCRPLIRTYATVVSPSETSRSGDAVEDAADTVLALSGPQVYGLLVHDRGWSPERYQAWLVDRLVAALLGPAGST